MEPQQRFEILNQIAAGDYATVFRARDRELGREVAIKQIHPQFLQDPRQLDRYWQEAQLLASLDHPHIMMIYDIVRDRGWLVLELMTGSLQGLLAGRPIDLSDLRMALTYSLSALQYMHEHGIVHGDVKPSNLLVDRNHRVKLGDFGIARRVTGDHGSVVKGTTKYMAPEVVSDQFGDVGPHSDLYSLGFSAFELMCGENFETLFPGLNMFGRDKQIAWMMWHSAPDRRLPDIDRVLQGVPPDLAYVIQRLTEKDPAKRYRTAAEVLDDLQRGTTAETAVTQEQLAAAAKAERAAKRRRLLAIGAFVVSTSMSLAVALWPEKKPPPAPPPAVVRPVEGVVGEIDLERSLFFLKPREEGETPHGVVVDAEQDRVFINQERASLEDLQLNDAVTFKYLSSDGVEFKEIYAVRPEMQETTGVIASIDAGAASLQLAAPANGEEPAPWYVPEGTPIRINGESKQGMRPWTLADLRSDDRVVVAYVMADEGRHVARSIVALRTLTLEGTLVSRNPQQGKIVVELSGEGGTAKRTFTMAAKPHVTVNGQEMQGDVPLTIANLNTGDRVTITADAIVHSLAAQREVNASGTIADVNYPQRTLKVSTSEGGKTLEFAMSPQVAIRGTKKETLEFDFLRRGDQVAIEYSPLSGDQLQALTMDVRPATDPRAWAIVIGQAHYDDAGLPALPQAAGSAESVTTALRDRYRIPGEQLLHITDGSRLQIEQGLMTFLAKVPAEGQLICYYAGHAVADPSFGVQWTPKEFDRQRVKDTGLPLKTVVKQMESCAAREKILLLDSCHEQAGVDPAVEPSSAEQAELLKEKPTRPVSTNVLVIASNSRGQRATAVDEGQRTVFGSVIGKAFAGEADANRDGRVAVAELLEFLPRTMQATASASKPQTAVVFQPDARPPRLTQEARDSVTKMLRFLRANRFDETMTAEFQAMQGLAPKEPELPLAYGLVLLRHNRTLLARPALERVRLSHPKSPVAHQVIAWLDFLQGKPGEGVAALQQMVANLPDTTKEPGAEPYVKYALQYAGSLRQYAIAGAENPLMRADVEGLDQAVIARGNAAKEAYRAGVDSARDTLARIDMELAQATADRRPQLQLDRKRPTAYATLNYTMIADFIRLGMED